MAQKAVDTEVLTCAMCLEQLKGGHSFCRSCVQSHWDQEQSKTEHSCAKSEESFSSRPGLLKTIKDSLMKETVNPEDVLCDVCSGTKLKAVYSCLQCVLSYCEDHLQPHVEDTGLRKHQLLLPSGKLQHYFCSEHKEVKKMFCRSDQQLMCIVCCLDQHNDCHTVACAVARVQIQAELEETKQHLEKTISDSETDLKRLQEEAQALSRSAQDAVQHSWDSFTHMILLLEKQRSEVNQQIKDQEKSELRKVQELQDQVQLDITQMKKTLSEMDTVVKTLDDVHFLEFFSKVPKHRPITAMCTVLSEQMCGFDSVTTAVSALREKVQLSLTHSEVEVSKALTEIHTLLFSRKDFLNYACDITLDPNTAHQHLCLSEGNRRVTRKSEAQNYPEHPDRFTGSYKQVLSREALTGRCYWEVEWSGTNFVSLALAYRDNVQSSDLFGYNDQSWALDWYDNSFYYRFNYDRLQVSGLPSSRLGVFLDHSAGLLSFYSVQELNLIRIHRVRTTFTQPLHVGVWIYDNENSVCFPQIK